MAAGGVGGGFDKGPGDPLAAVLLHDEQGVDVALGASVGDARIDVAVAGPDLADEIAAGLGEGHLATLNAAADFVEVAIQDAHLARRAEFAPVEAEFVAVAGATGSDQVRGSFAGVISADRVTNLSQVASTP